VLTRSVPANAITAESLFRTFFLALYPVDTQADLNAARTTDANPAKNPALFAQVEDAARVFVRMSLNAFGEDLVLDGSDASVHRLSRALTPARRDGWATNGTPGTADNELFNVVVHGAAYVGECVVHAHGGSWSLRRPLWESLVSLESRAGKGELAVFHWWLKSLADAAHDEEAPHTTLADRYRAHVEIPCARPEELPILAPGDRALPRLSKVRYDTLYKHLKAHLPELRDLGEDFPSALRFDAYGFKWLDFVLVGGGRMLLVHGPGEGGVFAFWVTTAGFEKSVFFPGDAFPAHVVRLVQDKVVFLLPVFGKTQTHELLWWGP
jgi:hypothetical protein